MCTPATATTAMTMLVTMVVVVVVVLMTVMVSVMAVAMVVIAADSSATCQRLCLTREAATVATQTRNTAVRTCCIAVFAARRRRGFSVCVSVLRWS